MTVLTEAQRLSAAIDQVHGRGLAPAFSRLVRDALASVPHCPLLDDLCDAAERALARPQH